MTDAERQRHVAVAQAWSRIIRRLITLRRAQGYLDEEHRHWLEVAQWEKLKVEQCSEWARNGWKSSRTRPIARMRVLIEACREVRRLQERVAELADTLREHAL